MELAARTIVAALMGVVVMGMTSPFIPLPWGCAEWIQVGVFLLGWLVYAILIFGTMDKSYGRPLSGSAAGSLGIVALLAWAGWDPTLDASGRSQAGDDLWGIYVLAWLALMSNLFLLVQNLRARPLKKEATRTPEYFRRS